jgi:hypothetical protein
LKCHTHPEETTEVTGPRKAPRAGEPHGCVNPGDSPPAVTGLNRSGFIGRVQMAISNASSQVGAKGSGGLPADDEAAEASMTEATSTTPDQVATKVRSATPNWLGLVAEKSRSTRSAGRAAAAWAWWSCGACCGGHLPGPAHPSAAPRCSGPPRLPPSAAAATPWGRRRPQVLGMDPADLDLQLLVAASADRGRPVRAAWEGEGRSAGPCRSARPRTGPYAR